MRKYQVGQRVHGLGIHGDVTGKVVEVERDEEVDPQAPHRGTVAVQVMTAQKAPKSFKPSVRKAFSDFATAAQREVDGDVEEALDHYEESWKHLR